jgi:hypothetical protein
LRKFVAVVIGTLFVLGLAATAFAIHAEIPAETQAVVAKGQTQIHLGGSVRTRGEIRETDFDSDTTTAADYDQRVRLSVDAKVTDNVEGFIMLETGNDLDADVYKWGTPTPGGSKGIYSAANGGGGNVKGSFVNLLQGWIQYTPGVVGIKIGHMPLALGNNLFFNHTKFGDDAIIVFATPTPEIHLAALAIKFEEGGSGTCCGNSSDQDGYVALAVYKGEGFNLSGDVTWVNINPGSTFALADADVINIGVRGDVMVGPAKLYGDVEFQTGKLIEDTPAELDVKGYAFQVGASADIDSVNLGVEFGLGSGDDDPADGDFGLYITSLGAHRNVPNAFVYGYRVFSSVGATHTGISNTTYVRATAGTALTDAISADAQVYWLQATEKVGGEDEIGWEIDGRIKYKVARNLLYWVEGGYLIAGDMYSQGFGTADDDVYAVRHGLELTF